MVTDAAVFPARAAFQLGELTVVAESDRAVVRGPSPAGPTIAADIDVVRELVSRDVAGRYRPLAGARSLPSGLQAECHSTSEMAMIIDAIYPLAPAHVEQWRDRSLRIVALAEVLSRQTARYAVANDLTPDGRTAAAESLCGCCVKQPLWNRPADPPPADAPVQVVPCPEPCSVLVSLCREAALWEKNMPSVTPVDATVPFADFEAPGNEVREDCLDRLRTASGAPRG